MVDVLEDEPIRIRKPEFVHAFRDNVSLSRSSSGRTRSSVAKTQLQTHRRAGSDVFDESEEPQKSSLPNLGAFNHRFGAN